MTDVQKEPLVNKISNTVDWATGRASGLQNPYASRPSLMAFNVSVYCWG